MIPVYFFVILFSFSLVMLLRSLIHQRWNDIAIYFVLLAFSFISIGAMLTYNILAPMGRYIEVIRVP